jgi:hypothetical protein
MFSYYYISGLDIFVWRTTVYLLFINWKTCVFMLILALFQIWIILWNNLWLVIPNLTLYFLYLCCFTLHCFIFYSATVSGITWCIQPWCVYKKTNIKCWQGGREEAVLYGLWLETGSGRGSYINSQINGSIFSKYIINQNMCCL